MLNGKGFKLLKLEVPTSVMMSWTGGSSRHSFPFQCRSAATSTVEKLHKNGSTRNANEYLSCSGDRQHEAIDIFSITAHTSFTHTW